MNNFSTLPPNEFPAVPITSTGIHWDTQFVSQPSRHQCICPSLSMISPLPVLCYTAKLWEKSQMAMPSFPSWVQLYCPVPGNPLGTETAWRWRMEGEKKTQQPVDCDASRAAWMVSHSLELAHCEPGWLFLNIVKYFHTGSNFIFPQNVCRKLCYFISLYQIACLWANSKWNFGFSGAQRAEVETLPELKLFVKVLD